MASKESLFKNFIIRVDYSGMISINDVVNSLSRIEWFKAQFDTYARVQAEDKKSIIHRFYRDNRSSKRMLEISDDSCILTLSDEQLQDSQDTPSEFMGRIVDKICELDVYCNINRVGIRKIYGKECSFDDADDYFKYFDQKIIDTDNGELICERNYVEVFEISKNQVFVIYNRTVKVINNNKCRFIIDIDIYDDNPEKRIKAKQVVPFMKSMEDEIPSLYNRSVKRKYQYEK